MIRFSKQVTVFCEPMLEGREVGLDLRETLLLAAIERNQLINEKNQRAINSTTR